VTDIIPCLVLPARRQDNPAHDAERRHVFFHGAPRILDFADSLFFEMKSQPGGVGWDAIPTLKSCTTDGSNMRGGAVNHHRLVCWDWRAPQIPTYDFIGWDAIGKPKP
jgi:hypothetical protein